MLCFVKTTGSCFKAPRLELQATVTVQKKKNIGPNWPRQDPVRLRWSLSSPHHYSHMAGFVSDHKGGGEAVLVVQSAAPQWVAHPGHRSVTWATEKTTQP